MSLFDILDDAAREGLTEQGQPDWTAPMLATLIEEPFSDPDWIFERKLDGVRGLAFRRGATVRLMSRTREQQNGSYPELVEALEAVNPTDFIADGEIVAFEGRRTSFSRLQHRMQLQDPDAARATGIRVFYYAFDLLHLDGHDTTGLPLRDRKRLLRSAFRFRDPLRFLPHRNEGGEEHLDEACRRGWEGLIAKRASSPYAHSRSRDWLKLKCVSRQELVIGGFTEPHGTRKRFGALLVGYHDRGELVYAGKVGTGYDEETLESLGDALEAREREASPFSNPEEIGDAEVRWVAPELVGEFGFTEWTDDGKLRHPRFLGLRRDKDAGDVARERPS